MTNPTDLAAALNECMPLMIAGTTYVKCVSRNKSTGALRFVGENDEVLRAWSTEVFDILAAECVRRGWIVAVDPQTAGGLVQIVRERPCEYIRRPGTDALAFARAFAAAKRAEGGGSCG